MFLVGMVMEMVTSFYERYEKGVCQNGIRQKGT